MKRLLLLAALAIATLGSPAGAASAASDEAGCVGQLSSFFAQGWGGTHRSELAQEFAHDARPAGQNVYSAVAQFRGTLAQCFEQDD
jgi:hypothetical protein